MTTPRPKFKATNKDGKIYIQDKDKFGMYLSTVPEEISVVVKPWKETRSDRQNRYYFGVVVKLIADETGHTKDEIHEFLKAEFNSYQLFIKTKSGREIERTVTRSTTKMQTDEFHSYIEKIREWAFDNFQINIPDPDQVDY